MHQLSILKHLRPSCIAVCVMTALCTFAESKVAVFDFAAPETLSPQASVNDTFDNTTFTCDDVSLTIAIGDATRAPKLMSGYVKLYTANQISVKAGNNATITGTIFLRGYDSNSFTPNDFLITAGSDEHINVYSKDGKNYFSIPGGDLTIQSSSSSSQYIAKIEVNYEIEESTPEPPVIEDMPANADCKKFDKVTTAINTHDDYVLVSGNYIATGKVNEVGHLEVVKFNPESGISAPLGYSFRFVESENDTDDSGEPGYYISTPDREYLAADPDGHFKTVATKADAAKWRLTLTDGAVSITEADILSRAGEKSIMFSSQGSGFGRYDAADPDAEAPMLYAYADPTLSIGPEILESATDMEAEYFDLRGMQVEIDHAVPGIYICRRGTRASKVVIR